MKGRTLATRRNMDKYESYGPIAWSPATGEEYSATSGDYFMRYMDEPLEDANGDPMILVARVTNMVDVADLA